MTRRFSLFFFGVLLGSLFVYFTLIRDRDRNFLGWLPSPRVITKLQMTIDTTNQRYLCLTNCYKLNNNEFENLLEEGDVDFERSDTKSQPRRFFIDAQYKGLAYILTFTLYGDTLSNLNSISVSQLEKECNCE